MSAMPRTLTGMSATDRSLTPTMMAPLNRPVMSMTVRNSTTVPVHLEPLRRLAQIAAFGNIAQLMPPVSLRSSSASTLRVRVADAGCARHRLPHLVSSCVRATADNDSVLRTSAVMTFGAPRRVLRTTPITTAPVNMSVISRTMQQLGHCADSLRTGRVSARLAAFGDFAPLAAAGLAALVVVTAALRSRRPVRASPVTGLRTTPCTCASATAGATAIASVSVLDTTAFATSRTLRHSIAVEAPSAGSSGTHSPSLVPLVSSFLTACAGSGSHTRRTPGAVAACLRLRAHRHRFPAVPRLSRDGRL